jgi:hypothetical protein
MNKKTKIIIIKIYLFLIKNKIKKTIIKNIFLLHKISSLLLVLLLSF